MPHNFIKDKPVDLTERIFQREGSLYIACNDRVVYRVGILGQLFATPPQLLEHHPIELWGFWDNFLEHHLNFWTWRQGSPRRLAFQASRVKAAYNREDLVRLVGNQDVRRRGIRVEDLELISRRALDDAKAAIAGKPVSQLLASREWVFNISFNYGFILRSRRPEVCPDVLYASPLLHRVRQLIYSRRPPQQVQSARYQYNSLRAFLCPSDRSDFLELFPELAPCFAMYERFVNNVVDFVINPAEIKNGREGFD